MLNNLYDTDQLKDLFPSIYIQIENPIIDIKKSDIIKAIIDYFEKENIIEIPNYIVYGLVYIYAISIPLYPFEKLYEYLDQLREILVHLKIFARQVMYFFMLVNGVLRENFMTPNEEMMQILHEFFSSIIYQERESIYGKLDKKEVVVDETNFKIEKNKNFFCFMKHNFSEKKMYNSFDMVNMAYKEDKNTNVVIKGKKDLYPTVNVKINDYFYSSDFFSPMKIYKLAQSTYDDFFDKYLF